GFAATGLAAMLASELGVAVTKRYQQHDWSLRPLTPEQIGYLAGDVAHLIALDARLAERTAALGIADEAADECAYKLATAARPPARVARRDRPRRPRRGHPRRGPRALRADAPRSRGAGGAASPRGGAHGVAPARGPRARRLGAGRPARPLRAGPRRCAARA